MRGQPGLLRIFSNKQIKKRKPFTVILWVKSQGVVQFSVASGVGAAMTLKIQREAGGWGPDVRSKGKRQPHSLSTSLFFLPPAHDPE